MRKAINTLAVLLALTAGGVPPALAQEENPQIDCANAMAQVELNYCADQEFQKADKELNLIYKKALAAQQQVDKEAAEMNPAYVGAVKALKKAQRAWIDYRDGHCLGVGYEAVGGSMQPMLISGCMASLTLVRTKELNDLVKGAGN